MTGYSKRSLADKLGLKQEMSLLILNEPENYFELIGKKYSSSQVEKSSRFDFIHFFTKEKSNLEKMFPFLKTSLKLNGMLWISWPKTFRRKVKGSEPSRTTKLNSDLNENIIRDIGLGNGLVDVKVAAIDEDWSGLKFVYRLKDRN